MKLEELPLPNGLVSDERPETSNNNKLPFALAGSGIFSKF